MKTPDPDDARRCIELRRRLLQGVELFDADVWFIDQMMIEYSEWYVETQAEVEKKVPIPAGLEAYLEV